MDPNSESGQAEEAPVVDGQATDAPAMPDGQPEIAGDDANLPDLGTFQRPEGWDNFDEAAKEKAFNAFYQTSGKKLVESKKQEIQDLGAKAKYFDMMNDPETRTRLATAMGWTEFDAPAAPQPEQVAEEVTPLPEYLDSSDPKAMAEFIDKRSTEKARVIAKQEMQPHIDKFNEYVNQQKQSVVESEFNALVAKYPDALALRMDMAPLVDQAGVSIPDAYAMIKSRNLMKERGLDMGAIIKGNAPATPASPPNQVSTSATQTQPSDTGTVDLSDTDSTKAILLAQAASGDEVSIKIAKDNNWL